MNMVTIQVDMTDDEWYTLMKIAHDQDITLNQLVNNILEEELLKYGSNSATTWE